MLRHARLRIRCAALGLVLLGACAGPAAQLPSSTPAPQQAVPPEPIDQLLERLRLGQPLVGGAQDRALAHPLCLVRPLRESQLERLLELGHERALIQALFVPGAGQHPAHGDLLDGLRKLQTQYPTPAQAEFIESLCLAPAWRRAEDLRAVTQAGQVQLTVAHWDVPIRSLAKALRSTAGTPKAATRALLAETIGLLDTRP